VARPKKTYRARGQNDTVMTARAINAEPWEPLPGMTKRLCRQCSYWFATPSGRQARRCADCAKLKPK
jgi:hypothetical protein